MYLLVLVGTFVALDGWELGQAFRSKEAPATESINPQAERMRSVVGPVCLMKAGRQYKPASRERLKCRQMFLERAGVSAEDCS